MKKFAMLAVVLIFGSSVAQTTAEAPTDSSKLEAFLSKKGLMIVREQVFDSYVNGNKYIGSLEVEGVKVYEPSKESSAIKGAVITVTASDKSYDTATEFLDFEELQSLNDAISYMMTLAPIWESKTMKYTEIKFSTKSGFIFGMYKSDKSMLVFAKASSKTVFLEAAYLSEVKTLVSNLIKSF